MAKKAKGAKKKVVKEAWKVFVKKTEPMKPVSKTINRLRKGLSRY